MRRTTAQRAMSDEAATKAALTRRELESPCAVLWWCRRDLGNQHSDRINTQIVTLTSYVILTRSFSQGACEVLEKQTSSGIKEALSALLLRSSSGIRFQTGVYTVRGCGWGFLFFTSMMRANKNRYGKKQFSKKQESCKRF